MANASDGCWPGVRLRDTDSSEGDVSQAAASVARWMPVATRGARVLDASPCLKEPLPLLPRLEAAMAGELDPPGGDLRVAEPKLTSLPGRESKALQFSPDDLRGSLALVRGELADERQDLASESALAVLGEANQRTDVRRQQVGILGAGCMPKVTPEATAFIGVRERQGRNQVEEVAASSLIVGNVTGCRSGDVGDVLRSETVVRPLKWDVEMVVEVLGEFVVLMHVSLDDQAVPPRFGCPGRGTLWRFKRCPCARASKPSPTSSIAW